MTILAIVGLYRLASMWYVTYLGILLAPLIALALSLVALRMDAKQGSGVSSLFWVTVSSVLAGCLLAMIFLSVDSAGKGDFDSFAPALLAVLVWLVALGLALVTAVVGIARGRKWKSRLLQVLGGAVLFLIIVLPAINWVAPKVQSELQVRHEAENPAEYVPFTVYAPGYVPAGYTPQDIGLDKGFADGGIRDPDDDTVGSVSQRFDSGDSLSDPSYKLTQFDVRHAQPGSNGCIEDTPRSAPTKDATPPPFSAQDFPCSRKGTMPSGEAIYIERKERILPPEKAIYFEQPGAILIATTRVGKTALVLLYNPKTSKNGPGEPGLLRMMRSMERVDKEELNEKLKQQRKRNEQLRRQKGYGR